MYKAIQGFFCLLTPPHASNQASGQRDSIFKGQVVRVQATGAISGRVRPAFLGDIWEGNTLQYHLAPKSQDHGTEQSHISQLIDLVLATAADCLIWCWHQAAIELVYLGRLLVVQAANCFYLPPHMLVPP